MKEDVMIIKDEHGNIIEVKEIDSLKNNVMNIITITLRTFV